MAVSTAALHPSSFPVMSFLHVPGKMSQPLWLMMGTAFLLRPAPDVEPEARSLLLSAKHTFSPWQYLADPARLKIPDAFRKTRYVVGRLYLPDAHGAARRASALPLRLVALHPTRDVALLALSDGGEEWRQRVAAAGGGVSLANADPMDGAHCEAVGFRGAGALGELDTLDPDLLPRMPPSERDALIAALRDVEGQQVAAAARLEVLDSRGMCRAVDGRCYHGMSGAPLLDQRGACGGVLYGTHAEYKEHFGYTPTSAFSEWLQRTSSGN